MQATVELLDLKPSAIEHVDRPLLDQTKGQLLFQAARDLLELDAKPCESILIVEFYDDVARATWRSCRRTQLGLRTKICNESGRDESGLGVRKAGLSLLTGCWARPNRSHSSKTPRSARHSCRPMWPGCESIMRPLGLEASYYGHAASGLAPCPAGARSARRGRSEEIPAGRGSSLRAR